MRSHLSECDEDDFSDCPLICGYLDRTVEVLLTAQEADGRATAGALTWPDLHANVHAAMAGQSIDRPVVGDTASASAEASPRLERQGSSIRTARAAA